MKIAVLLPTAPFVYGGAEKMADDLVYYLNKYGHQAKRYDMFLVGNKARHIVKSLLSSTCFRFDDVDLVIPLTPPCIGVNHSNVVPWLIGQTKAFYEFYNDVGSGFGRFGAEGKAIKKCVVDYDTKNLKKLSRVYTISPRTQELFEKYNGIKPDVLILPLQDSDKYYCEEYGDFVMYHSRIHYQKRQFLAVKAMCYTKTNVKLLIAGADNAPQYTEEMQNFIVENNLQEKVIMQVGHFSDEQKFEWLSKCLAGFYLGEDEDYWAIVTTEVMMSKKPVIAPTDTGATKYVVKDGITGFQPEGTPQAIAEAMDKLYLDKKAAQRMGEAGNDLIRKISPSWETVVHTLTGEVK